MSDQPSSSLKAVCLYFGIVSAGLASLALTVALHDRPVDNKTTNADPCEELKQRPVSDENPALKTLECGLRHGLSLRYP
ncbi:MAG: hypothetical protein HYS17_05810 [Micavibrio aeruginosavorus]|uniref:Uncharacterized protein n=1 Tax=Micavibrio aeruginosavorus TaxID=349221 RepID=A0A7T5UHU5_9BACT|nr:MAG: hypothetical protein HYS17_05810 [Micavibrio aeruginosavorus]